MLARAVLLPRLGAAATRRVPQLRLAHAAPLSTQGSPAAAVSQPAAAAAPAATLPPEEPDNRPFVLRWWKSMLFWSLLGTWAFSLVQQNRSRRSLEEKEETVRGQAPVNADEILELRALNDVSTAQLASLQDVARTAGSHAEATLSELLAALTRTVGKPIREECAIERMLLALQELRRPAEEEGSAAAGGGAPGLPVGDVAAALAFLSNGPVSERLDALFLASADGGACATAEGISGAVSRERFVSTLAVLQATGQVPPEKQVALDALGPNALGLDRSWYLEQAALTYSAAELADAAATELAKGGLPEPAAWYQLWRWGEERAVADAGRAAAGGGLPCELDRVLFGKMLVSDAVCLWGECHLISERKRIQKRRQDAANYEASPPAWQVWKWGAAKQESGAA